MTTAPETDARFPIGKFDPAAFASREDNVETLASFPWKLRAAVEGLSDEQLDTPYREGGWTLRQTVHHVADSHMNTLVRFKLALTEVSPVIRPYMEDLWAELPDSKMPVEVSLNLVEGTHRKLTEILRNISDADFQLEFVHPETGPWSIEKAVAMYTWHSEHHLAHISSTRERNGW